MAVRAARARAFVLADNPAKNNFTTMRGSAADRSVDRVDLDEHRMRLDGKQNRMPVSGRLEVD